MASGDDAGQAQVMQVDMYLGIREDRELRQGDGLLVSVWAVLSGGK